MEDQETTLPAIKQVQTSKEQLEQLRDSYKNLLVTPETVKDANKARLVLYRARIDIQKVEKDNNDILNDFKKRNAKKADELIAIIQPLEMELKLKIDAIEGEEKRKKEEEVKAEQARIKRIKDSILELESRVVYIRLCKFLEELDKIALEVSTKENSFLEFNEEGNAMVKSVLNSIEARKLALADEKAIADKKLEEACACPDDDMPIEDGPKERVLTFNTKQHGDHTVNLSSETKMQGPPADKDIFAESQPTKKIFPPEAFHELIYNGYEFRMSANVPHDVAEKIASFIKEVIDEIPM